MAIKSGRENQHTPVWSIPCTEDSCTRPELGRAPGPNWCCHEGLSPMLTLAFVRHWVGWWSDKQWLATLYVCFLLVLKLPPIPFENRNIEGTKCIGWAMWAAYISPPAESCWYFFLFLPLVYYFCVCVWPTGLGHGTVASTREVAGAGCTVTHEVSSWCRMHCHSTVSDSADCLCPRQPQQGNRAQLSIHIYTIVYTPRRIHRTVCFTQTDTYALRKKNPVALVPWTAGSYGAPESAYESFRIGPDSRAPGLEGCAGSRRKPERFRGSSLVNTRATANAVGGSNGGGNSRAEGAPLNLVHHAVCACGCGGWHWLANQRQASDVVG